MYLALCFTQTECHDEWLVVQRRLLPMIRTRARFKERVPPSVECELAHIGSIGNIQVFLELKADSFSYDFMCGSNLGAAVGQVINHPHFGA